MRRAAQDGALPLLYLHFIEAAESPACARCGAARDDTQHYLLDCPAHKEAREELGPAPEITVLAREPEKVAAFLRRSGRIEDHRRALEELRKSKRAGRKPSAAAGPSAPAPAGRKGGKKAARR